jgi:hypothetical protein
MCIVQVLQSIREENSENLSARCRGEILKGFLFRKVSFFLKCIQFLIAKSIFLKLHIHYTSQLNFFTGLTKKYTKLNLKFLLKLFHDFFEGISMELR